MARLESSPSANGNNASAAACLASLWCLETGIQYVGVGVCALAASLAEDVVYFLDLGNGVLAQLLLHDGPLVTGNDDVRIRRPAVSLIPVCF